MRRVWMAIVIVCFGEAVIPRVGAAQRPSLEPLEALMRRISRHPDDTQALCEAGWLRFLRHRDLVEAYTEHARSLLDRGILHLGTPTTRVLSARLGSCLYSRGRVAEADGTIAAGIPYYERSLAVRPNAVVSARLAGAHRAVAAGWVDVPIQPGEATPATVAAEGELGARYENDAGDEILVAQDMQSSRFIVAARMAGRSFHVITAWESDVEEASPPSTSFIEAPAAPDELVRVVVTYALERRYADVGDGPDYESYVHACTIALMSDGTLRVIARDERHEEM